MPHQPENPLSASVVQLGKRVVQQEHWSTLPRPTDRVPLDQPQRERHRPALPAGAERPHLYFTFAVAAMLVGLDRSVRGIVTGISVEYLKKARGRLVAESRVEVPRVSGPVEQPVHAEITDASGDLVARVTAHWLLSPREEA